MTQATNLFGNAYRGKRVLVTGHTGFKGSWLALWLEQLGAEVHGLALAPEASPNHWALLNLPIHTSTCDIRNANEVAAVVTNVRPDIVFHLAAQSLVRRSYAAPLETWNTNVQGTANLLEACRTTPGVRAIVVVTSDKCYENREWPWGYRENDALGGHDPYSASKAAAELVAASYRKSFFARPDAPLLATARAGNVIGGGDWSENRLIPDLVRAISAGQPLVIRSPRATRPWQHVLESLAGYLLLGQRLLEGKADHAQAWNFGPTQEDNRSVEQVLVLLQSGWPQVTWQHDAGPAPHEATMLYVDSALARGQLNWQPVWRLERAVSHTAAWYKSHIERGTVLSREQIATYVADATAAQAVWTFA